MSETPPPIAAMVAGDGDLVDEMLDAFASRLLAEGVRVRGLVQRYHGEGCACAMELVDLGSGESWRISQDLGAGSTSCRVDPSGVAAASVVLRRALDERPELVVVNRFGGLEKNGQGLADEMLAVMAEGIPFLTVVGRKNLDAWHAFCGGASEILPADATALQGWFARVRASH